MNAEKQGEWNDFVALVRRNHKPEPKRIRRLWIDIDRAEAILAIDDALCAAEQRAADAEARADGLYELASRTHGLELQLYRARRWSSLWKLAAKKWRACVLIDNSLHGDSLLARALDATACIRQDAAMLDAEEEEGLVYFLEQRPGTIIRLARAWKATALRNLTRAEAAEAALAEAEYNLDSLRLERNMAETLMRKREVELSALRAVLTNADAHHGLVPSIAMLREEVAELEAALAGNHPHPPELELTQIGGIVVNWLRRYDLIPVPVGSSKLSALRAVAEAMRRACTAYGLAGAGPAQQLDAAMNDGAGALAALDAARGRPASRLMEQMPPCSHPGCYSHVTHPCEGCGRIQGYLPSVARGGGEEANDG